MAPRARALTDIDAAEWATFARRIVALPGRPSAVAAPDALPGEAAARPGSREPLPGSAASHRPAPISVGGQPAGVDTATWQRFHRGQVGSVRKLDLHGMTAQHAFQALRSFLRAAHADRVRCVEVVTGRGSTDGGGGVLRRELPLWLNLPEIRPLVLAAAHPHASNAMHSRLTNPGAVRLLLRRPRA
jgi:DNA-nicking Smr family endonuclease